MSRCWCSVVLPILVIVFAWVDVSWAAIALTVLGALLLIKALKGKCCCEEMMKKYCQESKEGEQERQAETEQE